MIFGSTKFEKHNSKNNSETSEGEPGRGLSGLIDMSWCSRDPHPLLGMNSASGSCSGCHVELQTRWSFLPPSSSLHQLLITDQGCSVISRSRSTKWENDTQLEKKPEDLLAFTWNWNNEGDIDLIKIKFNYMQSTARRDLFEEMSLQNYVIADLAHNDLKGFIKYIYRINNQRILMKNVGTIILSLAAGLNLLI